MTDILLRVLCAAVVIPGAVLCCLPVRDHLRVSPGKLVLWGVPAVLLWAFLVAFICVKFKIADMNLLLLPSLVVFALLYARAVNIPAGKSVSVFLAVCALFSILDNIALETEQLIIPGVPGTELTWQGAAAYNLLCWLAVGLLWYPASRNARWLLDELETPATWRVFWILPLSFMLLNTCLPTEELSMGAAGFVPVFLVLLLFQMALLLLCYAMFYFMARSLGENMRLQNENNLLQLEASQYESLKNSIEETRRIRHDLRQHFAAIQGCVDRGDISGLSDYLAKYRESLPGCLDDTFSFCDNYAINSVLHFYADKARKAGVEFTASVRMSEHIPVPEPELCVLLGNLLENALNACTGQEGKPFIQVNILQNGASMLTVTVDNPCPLPPAWEGQRLISSRRGAPGIGTESVKAIARRCHGDARFQWEEGMFYASVMLNP